ncbi:MAG: sensor histidine kinase [Alphaproteobacteria bacterium]|nr:sensor histidine kinase [Alphaproteobacteria bacterium]
MSNYLRLFSLLSLGIIAGIAMLGGGWFKTTATDELTRMFEKNNGALAQGYINAVWQPHRATIVPLTQGDPALLKNNPEVTTFARATLRYFQQMPILRVNFYSSAGKLLMSGNVAKSISLPNSPASPDPMFMLTQMSRPTLGSQVIEGVDAATGEKTKILQTLIPVREPGSNMNVPPEAAIEILYDVTELWNQLLYYQIYGTGGILLVFMLFLVMLSVVSRHAEAIIAKQHEANFSLAAEAAAAQAQTEQKSQFLANISHELRTPLNAIIGFSDIIKNEVIATIHDQKYHDYINDIHNAGVHLLSLINDILDFSKAEAGKLELEVSEINAAKMVQNCLRLVQQRAQAANVTLVESIPKENCAIITDSKKFKQVMLNLLSNAVKFTPDGGSVTVKMWRNISDNSCTFEVVDTGIGIAPKDISKAMSPFGQVDNGLKRKYDGTGLGLPLTKKFVELLGGKFNIESVVGQGTTISFTLPHEVVSSEHVIVKQAS